MARGNYVRVGVGVKDDASGPLDRIRDRFERLQKQGAKGIAIGAGAAITTAGLNAVASAASRMTDLIGDSVNAASNLREAMTKSQAVFGPASRQIEQWAATAARSFGQSKRQALEAAGTFGNLFDAMGLAESKAVAMSKGIVQLATDLASFNNVTVDEALIALRSGLVGEVEPMRRFGVAINAASVEQKALAMGLARTRAELTESAKVQARYQLILENTTNAQGDFARTAHEAANQARILAAQAEDTSAKFGQVLLPIWIEVQRTIINALDASGMALEDFKRAATSGSQAAAAQWRGLEGVAKELGVSIEDAWRLMGETGKRSAEDIKEALRATSNNVRDAQRHHRGASRNFARELPNALEDAADESLQIVSDSTKDLVGAVRDRREGWQGAWEQYKEDLDNEMSEAAQIAKLRGILASRRLAEGIGSRDPLVRASAMNLREIVEGELARLRGDSWGRRLARDYAAGMKQNANLVKQAGIYISAAAAAALQLKSPAKEGPLSEGGGPEGWGRKFSDDYARGMRSRSLGSVARGMAGALRPITPALASGTGEVHIHAHFHGFYRAPTPGEGEAIASAVGPFLRDYLARRG